MICLAAINGLNLDEFDSIYVTILKKHSIEYQLKELLTLQFKRLNIATKAHSNRTRQSNQITARNCLSAIKQNQIKGHIFIKDADSYFETEMLIENAVCIYPLDELNQVNPQK